jgi:predicted acyl esterase
MRHPKGQFRLPLESAPPALDDEESLVRRAATLTLTTVLTAAGMVTLSPPASSAAEIVPRELTITVEHLGPEDVSCEIDADLYIPAGVTASRRAPALLVTNGFGGTKKDQADLARGFGDHGYVTLSYTGIGFVDGDDCPITLDDVEHDGAAASQLLRFLGGDRSIVAVDQSTGARVYVDQVIRQDSRTGTPNDPAVGMTGGSYGGQIQFATSAYEHQQGTDRVDAIVPLITWNDLSYSLAPENSSLPGGTARSGSVSSANTGVFKYQWAALFTTLGVENGVEDLPASLTDPTRWTAFVDANCGNFEPEVCRALLEAGTLGYPSQESIAFLRSNSVSSYMSDVRVPTMIGQGQADTLFNLQESVATYRALKRQGTPVSLTWQSWGHSDSAPAAGELDMRHPERSYEGRRALAWFDYYVRGQGTRPPLNFSYFRDWVFDATGDATKAYATAAAYPVGTSKTLYLSGGGDNGALVDSRSKVVPGESVYRSAGPIGPNYTETSGLDQSQPVTDAPGTAIRFSTAPLDRAMTVVGSPRLTVQLDVPLGAGTQTAGTPGELVVYAKLYDVGPDGAIELPHRLISPARVADVTKPVCIELPGIVHRFAAGHRLAVVLAGGDLAYRGSSLPQEVTVSTGGYSTQRLVLPVTA